MPNRGRVAVASGGPAVRLIKKVGAEHDRVGGVSSGEDAPAGEPAMLGGGRRVPQRGLCPVATTFAVLNASSQEVRNG